MLKKIVMRKNLDDRKCMLPALIALAMLLILSFLAYGCGGGGSASNSGTGSPVSGNGFSTDPWTAQISSLTGASCVPSPSWEVQLLSVTPATSTVVITTANALFSVTATYKNTGIALGAGVYLQPDNATGTTFMVTGQSIVPSSVASGAQGTWEAQLKMPATAGTYPKCFYLGANGICAVGGASTCWTFRVQ